jgi:hypothetical protein
LVLASWKLEKEQLRGKICGNGGCEKRRGALVFVGCVAEGRGTMERLREGRSDEGKGKSEGWCLVGYCGEGKSKAWGAGDFFFGRDGEWAAALVREKKGF